MDPHLEMAHVQRRVYEAGGPALFFARVKGSPFPAVSNLFGTKERCQYLFRHTLDGVRRILQIKADPSQAWRAPLLAARLPFTALRSLPRRVRRAPVLENETSIDRLPQLVSWPRDGGPFLTLPQVYTEDPFDPRPLRSNLGMYRIQLAGNDYEKNIEVGMHYQIHRGIGIHHSRAIEKGEPLRVSIFLGGPPAHTVAAVMPLPEGISELLFAGMLAGRRFAYTRRDGHLVSAQADFCITGTVVPGVTKPEGPFGDHLGYYSLTHEFPVLRVERVWHRRDAIFPFTVVGRPPQEDTSFGRLIHDLTRPLVPREVPGVDALHAVDATGVHPLLLARGSERYVPYGERIPRELLTQASAILGFGQCSLAKVLIIAAREDDPDLDVDDIPTFLHHVLERIDLGRDLHFHTRTTIDTLDYSGSGLNQGSKLVIAVAGNKKRELSRELPTGLSLPAGFREPRLVLPGVVAVEAPPFEDPVRGEESARTLARHLETTGHLSPSSLPLVLLVDDSGFCGESLRNLLWVTFTRMNPSHDVHGVHEEVDHKHWSCRGPLIIDARIKPHHAPPLVDDPEVKRRVDRLFEEGGPLAGIG